jgi:hypothetical protein
MRMTENDTQTIDMTPTWEWAVKIHLMALENTDADESVKQGARDEIIRLARAFDDVQKEARYEAE